MGTQVITQPQTFKSPSTVMGTAAGLSAVSGLTVYGDISASGTLYGAVGTLAPIKTIINCTGAATYTINGYTNTTAENYLVYLDGVHQVPGSDYTITANNITFSPAPAIGVVADILAFQTSVAAYSLSGIAPVLNTAAGTGSQFSFTINGFTNSTPQNYLVTVGGLVQRPGTDYTAGSNAIVFTSAPPNGAQILILAYQTLPGTANNTTIQVQTNGGSTSTVGTLNFTTGLSAQVAGGTATITAVVGGGSRVTIFDTVTANAPWTAPSDVNYVRCIVIGGGGGIDGGANGGANGGTSKVKIGTMTTAVSAGGGTTAAENNNTGGNGGSVAAVAGYVGAGTGGAGAAAQLQGAPGTGTAGGYGGGGGGGGGYTINYAYGGAGGGCGMGGGVGGNAIALPQTGALGGRYGCGASSMGGGGGGGGGGAYAEFWVQVTPNTKYTDAITVGAAGGGGTNALAGKGAVILYY